MIMRLNWYSLSFHIALFLIILTLLVVYKLSLFHFLLKKSWIYLSILSLTVLLVMWKIISINMWGFLLMTKLLSLRARRSVTLKMIIRIMIILLLLIIFLSLLLIVTSPRSLGWLGWKRPSVWTCSSRIGILWWQICWLLSFWNICVWVRSSHWLIKGISILISRIKHCGFWRLRLWAWEFLSIHTWH